MLNWSSESFAGAGSALSQSAWTPKQAFAQAINDSVPDLILADYQLGGFNGLEALAMVRQHAPTFPYFDLGCLRGRIWPLTP